MINRFRTVELPYTAGSRVAGACMHAHPGYGHVGLVEHVHALIPYVLLPERRFTMLQNRRYFADFVGIPPDDRREPPPRPTKTFDSMASCMTLAQRPEELEPMSPAVGAPGDLGITHPPLQSHGCAACKRPLKNDAVTAV